MVNSQINQMKTFHPTINKIIKEGRYDTEDVSEAERAYIAKHTPVPRASRIDLVAGDVVAVLEGAQMGKRVVYIRQLPDFKALVSGISSLNGVSLFKIDERYLLKLNSRVEIPEMRFDVSDVIESVPNEDEKMVVEPSGDEKLFEKQLLTLVSKIPYMKTYLSEPFKVDHSVDFYSCDN